MDRVIVKYLQISFIVRTPMPNFGVTLADVQGKKVPFTRKKDR
jgi:hypothetical protein